MRRFLISNLIFVFLIGSPVAAFAATKSVVKTSKPAVTQQAPGQTIKKEVQQRNIERKAELKKQVEERKAEVRQEVRNKIETKETEIKKEVTKTQFQNKPKVSRPTAKPKPTPRTFKTAPKKK